MPPLDRIRVRVAIPDPLARAGVRALLEHDDGLLVADDGDAAPERVVIVADLVEGASELPGEEAGHATGDAAGRDPVVALVPDAASARDALAAGVRGVLLRADLDGAMLAAAIRGADAGLLVIDPALDDVLDVEREGRQGGAGTPEAHMGPADTRPMDAFPADALTPRELEVLSLLAEGLSNRAIAARLGMSEHTAKFHVNSILSKLGARTRTEAVVRATRLGLLVL